MRQRFNVTQEGRTMPCTRSTACKFSRMESRLSVPGDGCRSPTDAVHSLRNLSFARGARHCLHVPGIRNALTVAFTIATGLDRDLIPVHTATLPERESWFRRKFCPTTPTDWLAAKTGCTKQDASERIASLPIVIPDRFDCMAL